ncbi:MAG: DUF1189 family protein [Candidatus Magasanikbacteria bacterium]|jgi:hypothetical protein|nr:DUF1189 family protein [Candidatus Magasanikbacteria bacterium]MBT5262691.1 DUF1189 family protein [Candidatus Magasanikbacteria bacterium]MBT5820305.1 DUF1189 family protein [Candidatus Magasanikbacteria bacterium]MBT6294807.1 DUF1189 family protein [Candidatus Magasanikbacteria bacterium]
MQKLQQLFRDFGKSLYDFEWIARQRGAGLRGMKLVALLAGVSCIVAMIFISQGITYVAGDIKKEVQQLPDFTASFEEKVLTVTGIEQPFTRRFEDVEKKDDNAPVVFHVDTNSDVAIDPKTLQENDDEVVISVGKESASFYDPMQKKAETFWYPESASSFTKGDVVSMVGKLIGVYGYALGFFAALIIVSMVFAWKLAYLLLLTWFAYVYNRLAKKQWTFSELYGVGLYAIICPSLVFSALMVFDVFLPFGYSVLVLVFFFMIIRRSGSQNEQKALEADNTTSEKSS